MFFNKVCYLMSIFAVIPLYGGTTMFTVTSSAFIHNGKIPSKYTCDGKDISPELRWVRPPQETKSFALIVDDPDAPKKTFVHWIVFNIPATVMELPENAKTNLFNVGTNDFNNTQYGGPCPPSGTHSYHFTLYALDTMINLPSGTHKEELLAAMKGHIVGKALLIGLYQRTR